MSRNLILVFIGALISGPEIANAQETTPTPGVAQSKAHRFFDSINVSLIVAESGALLADGITTQYALNHYGGREADPFARPFVHAGWPGMIAGGALFVSAEVGARYLLHRHNHHRMERWLPTFVIAYGATGAIHGLVEIHKANGAWRY